MTKFIFRELKILVVINISRLIIAGLPNTGKSEVLQGQYAKLILPAATYDYVDAIVTYVECKLLFFS